MSMVEQIAGQRTPNSGAVLIVSDAADAEIHRLRTALGEAGVPFETVPDVYTATAKLARRDWTGKVFVDVRTLDTKEMAFLRLVPRFFNRCEVVIPAFDGVNAHGSLDLSGLQPLPVAVAIEAAIAERSEAALRMSVAPSHAEHSTSTTGGPTLHADPAPSQPELAAAEIPETPLQQDTEEDELGAIPPPVQEDAMAIPLETEVAPTDDASADPTSMPAAPSPPLRLSTDGGPEEAGSGPAIHEVVRMRMAADDRRTIRRRPPPGATAPPARPVAPSADAGPARLHGLDPMLSPDEMDALLRDDDPASSRTPPADEAEGGEK